MRIIESFIKTREIHLNVSDGSAENGQIRGFLFVGRDRKLLFQRLKTFFEVSTSVLLKLVVDLASSSSNGRWTS